MPQKQLSIIIVNYKTPELIVKCLDSVKKTTKDVDYEIVVVDNCSNDNSEDLVLQKHNDVIWINNPTNDGFGRANNIGISASEGKYILLLNSDVIVSRNTIDECLKYIISNKNIGALGCKLLNEDGSLQKSVYYHTSDYSEILSQNLLIDYFFTFKNLLIKALMGSFLLIPRKVFEETKGFDPDFFMYCEELDLCNRITASGYDLKYLDEVVAYHKKGASSSNQTWVVKQIYLSKALLVYKEKGVLRYILYHLILVFNTFINFFLMWFLDKGYRKDFWVSQSCYYSNFSYYLSIPFLYSRQYGNEQRMLRSS